jgi:hypothetical protein
MSLRTGDSSQKMSTTFIVPKAEKAAGTVCTKLAKEQLSNFQASLLRQRQDNVKENEKLRHADEQRANVAGQRLQDEQLAAVTAEQRIKIDSKAADNSVKAIEKKLESSAPA